MARRGLSPEEAKKKRDKLFDKAKKGGKEAMKKYREKYPKRG